MDLMCLPLYVAGHHGECTGTGICVHLFLATQRRGALRFLAN